MEQLIKMQVNRIHATKPLKFVQPTFPIGEQHKSRPSAYDRIDDVDQMPLRVKQEFSKMLNAYTKEASYASIKHLFDVLDQLDIVAQAFEYLGLPDSELGPKHLEESLKLFRQV